MKTKLAIILLIAGLASGCSSVPPEPPDRVTESVQSTPTGAAAYTHTLEHSRFAIGSGISAKDEFGMHKMIGDQGVFATRKSGMVTALTNSDSAARHGTPIGDNASHNDAVRQYFVQAGLPADQIDSVEDREVVSVPASTANIPQVRTVQFRYTLITRKIQGISIPDSFAWARMNVDGAVVEEQVYWPMIPQSTIDAALAFSSHVADVAWLASFENSLPAHGSGKGLVIRHSPGEWDGAFVVGAYYDVIQKGDYSMVILHADQDGSIVTLPFEKPGAWGPETSTPRTKP